MPKYLFLCRKLNLIEWAAKKSLCYVYVTSDSGKPHNSRRDSRILFYIFHLKMSEGKIGYRRHVVYKSTFVRSVRRINIFKGILNFSQRTSSVAHTWLTLVNRIITLVSSEQSTCIIYAAMVIDKMCMRRAKIFSSNVLISLQLLLLLMLLCSWCTYTISNKKKKV